MKIKNPHSLIVGDKYKITHPVYDDYDEGLKPEIEAIEVFMKNSYGYIFKSLDYDLTYQITFNLLMNCEIEKI